MIIISSIAFHKKCSPPEQMMPNSHRSLTLNLSIDLSSSHTQFSQAVNSCNTVPRTCGPLTDGIRSSIFHLHGTNPQSIISVVSSIFSPMLPLILGLGKLDLNFSFWQESIGDVLVHVSIEESSFPCIDIEIQVLSGGCRGRC